MDSDDDGTQVFPSQKSSALWSVSRLVTTVVHRLCCNSCAKWTILHHPDRKQHFLIAVASSAAAKVVKAHFQGKDIISSYDLGRDLPFLSWPVLSPQYSNVSVSAASTNGTGRASSSVSRDSCRIDKNCFSISSKTSKIRITP